MIWMALSRIPPAQRVERKAIVVLFPFVAVWILGVHLLGAASAQVPSIESDTGLIPPGAGDAPCAVGETRLPNGACCAKSNVSGCGECCTDGLVPDAGTGKCVQRPELLR